MSLEVFLVEVFPDELTLCVQCHASTYSQCDAKVLSAYDDFFT